MTAEDAPPKADAEPPDAEEPAPTGIDRFIFQLESVISVLLLGGLIIAGLLPILFRGSQVLNTGWVEPFTHHAVLWIALFGAAVATRDRKHITVDALGQFLKPRPKLVLQIATDVLSAAVCVYVTVLCCRFVGQEWPGATNVKFWGLTERVLQLALPIGFAVISFRFVTSAYQNLVSFRKPPATDESAESAN